MRALDPDLGKVVLDLQVAGALSLAERKLFDERVAESIGAAVCGMRLDDTEIVLDPSEADLDEIDRLGFVRVAADRLRLLAHDNADRGSAEIAARALERLYLENIRQGGQS